MKNNIENNKFAQKEKFKIERYIEILENGVRNSLNKDMQKDFSRYGFRTILENVISKTGEYFDEQEFINLLRQEINNINDDNIKKAILSHIIVVQNGNERLNNNWRSTLEDIFRKHPDKKGINFRDEIKDRQELRGWLFLVTKDNRFKGDFERLISQKEKFYFRLWPPYISLGFKKLLPPKLKVGPEFDVGHFFKGIQSYIEDLQKGKDRITLWFKEDLLPDELQKISQDELDKLKIKKQGNIYEFYFTPNELKDIMDIWLGTYIEITKGETEINKLFKETYDLYNSLLKDAPSAINNNLRTIGTLIKGLEESYKTMIRTGSSKEELEKIKQCLDKCKQLLKELQQDVNGYKKDKKLGTLSKIRQKTENFLKTTGSIIITIITPITLWGLTIGWFLPLWLIAKMDETTRKFLNLK